MPCTGFDNPVVISLLRFFAVFRGSSFVASRLICTHSATRWPRPKLSQYAHEAQDWPELMWRACSRASAKPGADGPRAEKAPGLKSAVRASDRASPC